MALRERAGTDRLTISSKEFNSIEYMTELFNDLFNGDIQGWNVSETERNKN